MEHTRAVSTPLLGPLSLLVPLLGACGDAPPAGSFPEVRSPVPEARMAAPEVLRLGGADAVGPEVFAMVGFVGVDREGRVHVLDIQAQEDRVFDGEGRHVRTIGRRGEGPGETMGANGIGFPPDGTIRVWDPRQQRFSIYGSTLSFRGSEETEQISPTVGWSGRFGDDGSLYLTESEYVGLDPSRGETHGFEHVVRLVRLGPDLQSKDTIAAFSFPRTAFAGNFIVPFEPTGVHDFDPGGGPGRETLWFAPSAEYRILQMGAGGDTLRAFGLDVDPRPVTAAQMDSVVEATPPTSLRPELDRSLVPGVRPMVRLILHLGDGWVGVFPDADDETGRLLDVFAPDGDLAERVELAAPLRLSTRPWVHGSRLYGLTLDALDVPHVVALDLSEALGR